MTPTAVEATETRLREKRVERGMLQCELAKEARVGGSRLSQYERGWVRPTLPTAKRLAEALGCEVEELFPGEMLKAY